MSESSAYRILKAEDLITAPAHVVIKAANEFRDKTSRPNELWQTDFTYLDLLPAGPSFITRVCRLDLGIRLPRLAQARRAWSPQIAQASGALAAVSGWSGTSVA